MVRRTLSLVVVAAAALGACGSTSTTTTATTTAATPAGTSATASTAPSSAPAPASTTATTSAPAAATTPARTPATTPAAMPVTPGASRDIMAGTDPVKADKVTAAVRAVAPDVPLAPLGAEVFAQANCATLNLMPDFFSVQAVEEQARDYFKVTDPKAPMDRVVTTALETYCPATAAKVAQAAREHEQALAKGVPEHYVNSPAAEKARADAMVQAYHTQFPNVRLTAAQAERYARTFCIAFRKAPNMTTLVMHTALNIGLHDRVELNKEEALVLDDMAVGLYCPDLKASYVDIASHA